MEQNPRLGNTSGSSGGAQRKKSKVTSKKKPSSLNEEQLTGAQCVAEIRNAFDPGSRAAH